MQQEPIRIAVIDDDRLFAEVLASRLSVEPDLEVVGTAGSSVEALELFSHDEIDIVTLDLGLSGEDGLAVGRELRDKWPNVGIVVVTAAADDDRVCEAVQLGVRGWVAKQGEIETLLMAVRGAARGETHLPAALLNRVLLSLSEKGTSRPEAEAIALLTARELEVLHCLIEGLSRKEIGALLHVSPNTVRTHIQNILYKLSVHSALMAVAFARRAGVTGVSEDQATAPNDPRRRPLRSVRRSPSLLEAGSATSNWE